MAHLVSCTYGDAFTFNRTITTFDEPGNEAFLKTLWKKEKLLVTSNFTLSHNVFYPSQNKF